MTPVVHGIRNWDTVRKARAWLASAAIEHGFHDHGRDAVDQDVLRRAVAEHGWEAVLNRRGATFRGLPAALRDDLDEERAAALMLAHPSTIRRPVLDLGDRTVIGFSDNTYAALFGRT